MLLGKLSSTAGDGTAAAGVGGVWLRSSEVIEAALFLLADSPRAPRAGNFLFLSIAVAGCSTALGVVYLSRVAVLCESSSFARCRNDGEHQKLVATEILATPQQPSGLTG